MAFIIPNNVLETLICSYCHKFLSVKPIIVYPNRDVECGRCAVTQKQKKRRSGVESLYGKIIEKCLFKCINRFDGCRELLTCAQVPHHEKVCLEKIHKCPTCFEEMTSFLMLRHFHSKHEDAILDSSAFVFNLDHYSEVSSIYLYPEEDNLFFLYISYSKSENTIKFELVYMGSDKQASNIYHQFTVTSENKEFNIKCSSKPSCINDFSVVDVSNMSRLIYVKFKLIYQNLKFCTITENLNASSSSINNSLEISNLNQVETNPTNQIFTLTPNLGFALNLQFPPEYNPQCFSCKEICIYALNASQTSEAYYHSPIRNDYLCLYCFLWLTNNEKIKDYHFYVKHSTPSAFRSRFCKWNCGQHFKFGEILSHEIFCEKRIQYYNCPVQNCSIQNFALPLTNHLKNDHNYTVFASSIFEITALPVKCFVFVQDQIIHFQLTSQNDYRMDCKIVTNDKIRQLEWKPYVLFFSGDTLTSLGNLPSFSRINCAWKVKIVLMKNE
uniref:Uncharacterized protein LOC114342106 n=1 Tax=Diabrotica virgifera virgifera TaxID=50390 RepID=A0A6P7GG64_DIAVI